MKGFFKKARLGVIFISIIAFAMLGMNWDIKTRGLTIEQKKALEYGELIQEDYSTESENVEFSAFFTTDADNDGYVERRKGATVDLGNQTKELYFELKVNREGYLKDGAIEIDNGNNFTWETATISDNVVAGDYIGKTSHISLQDQVDAGNQKLFSGTIKDKIGKNINDYHKTNIVRLTGTYVDGQGIETPINVAKEVVVDWYGGVYSDINTAEQIQNVTTTEEYMIVEFDVVTMDRAGQLLLKDNNVTVTIPELNKYKAQSVTVDGVAVEIGDDNKISFHRSSQIDAQGNITKNLSRTNKYKVRVIYPIEARGQNEFGDPKTYTKIEIPVTSTYTGYNNQEEGFVNIEQSSREGVIILIKEKETQGDYMSQIAVDIGTYCAESQKNVVSKKKAIQAYNDIEVEDDTYEVTWNITREKLVRNLELQETTADEIVYNTGAQESLKDIVSYKGIYFKNGERLENIRIYNAKTNELIASFESGAELTESNPYMYDENIEKVRVKIDVVPSNSLFQIRHIKEIDDTAMVNKYAKAQFDTMVGIYSHLSAAGEEVAYTEVLGYSLYREEEAATALALSETNVSIRDNNVNQKITIITTKNDYNQIGWKNGEFLVEFPEEVIYAKVNDVTINNNEVEIVGYNLYKENGKYLLKIITLNEQRETYNITVDCNIQLNPIMNTGYGKFKLYGYNEDCNEYAWSNNDIYDINDNGKTNEKVSYNVEYMQIVAPSTLLTSHFASNFDEEETIVIASNIADINKETRTADININLLNNYDKTVSEVKILGTIPFENNTHIENDVSLGSTFTATMKSKIEVPEELLGKVTVYYTENETATKDLEDTTNGWTTTPADLALVRRYLIDFGNNVISSGARMAFKYTVEIPSDVNYNDFAYSTYVAYFSLEVDGGLLPTQIEPNKLGLRIVRKFELDLTKQNVENNKLVPGAVYQLSEMDENNQVFDTKLVTTNSQGKLHVKDLYVDRKYVLEEVKNPSNYMLNKEKIEFIVTEKPDRKLKIQVVSDEQFKTEPVVENNTISAVISENPRYQVNITKVDSATQEGLSKVNFELLPQNENYTTTKQGKLVLTNLDQNVEYTLKETYAEGYYLLNDITFKLEKDTNGNFKITSNNADFQNATIAVEDNEDLVNVTLNLKNERKPSILITKVDSKTNEPIKGVNFVVRNRPERVYVTGADGKVLINGFTENEEYVLEERKANGYYLQTITFTVTRDANNKLKIVSDNEAFANQVSVDEATKVISITLPNDPIPTYNLNLTKIEKDNISKKLQGAKFQLIEEDTNTIKEYTTDENGKINLTNLKAYVEGKGITGYYVLKELEAPAGYCNNSEEIRFRVVKNTNEELNVEIDNSANMATVEIAQIEEGTLNLVLEDTPLFTLTKVDSKTGAPLANAKFVILDLTLPIDFAKDVNGNYVGSLNDKGQYVVTTDENGKIILPLRDGKYAAIEIEFPEGYEEQEVVEGFEVGKIEEVEVTPAVEEINYIENVECIEDLVELSYQINKQGVSYVGRTVNLTKTLDFMDDASYRNPTAEVTAEQRSVLMGKSGTMEDVASTYGVSIGTIDHPFDGIFNGNGNAIKNINLKYNSSYRDEAGLGLFGVVRKGIIANLGVTGEVFGTYAYGSTNYNAENIGGIVGKLDTSLITNCYSKVKIVASTTYQYEDTYAGGIVGYSYGSQIKNCYNRGNLFITAGRTAYSAGICGHGSGTIENCYNTGNMESTIYYSSSNANYGARAGTITTDNTDTTINCYYLDTSTLTIYNDYNTNKKYTGTAKTSTFMKSDEFVGVLNDAAFAVDKENKNDGYPVLKQATINGMVTKIECINDLVELSNQIEYLDYSKTTVTLEKSLDFTDNASYRNENPNDTSYGDINGNGIIEGIKVELTTGDGFKPIGKSSAIYYTGIFDGNNKEIKNLYINRNEMVGLFGYAKEATIKDLKVIGTINTEYVDNYYGNAVGMIGYADNTIIENCQTELTINATGTSNYDEVFVGGIAGQVSNTQIKNCQSNSILNSNNVGGIVAKASATKIEGCKNIGNINITSEAKNIGGIAGTIESNSIVANSYNLGNITVTKGTYINVGGIVGNVNSYIKSCYNKGDISVKSDSTNSSGTIYAGGIGGNNGSVMIKDCYSIGNVEGQYTNISNSAYVGPILGNNYNVTNNCYYQEGIEIIGTNKNSYGIVKTAEQMKTLGFINELNNVTFKQDTLNENDGYPVLTNSEVYGIHSIKTVEDLVELSINTYRGEDYSNEIINLENTIDFTDDASYANPDDTSYGDYNQDGEPETIKEELSKGKGFTPISSVNGKGFKGIFDGNNNEIKNIYINAEYLNAALFSEIDTGTVKDLTISGKITGYGYVNGIAGKNNGTIENCINNAELIFDSSSYNNAYVAGIVGNNSGIVKNCANNANILTDSVNSACYLGGICSQNYGNIENCNNNGMLIVDGYKSTIYLGGIVGHNSNGQLVKNSYNTNDILISNEKYYGSYSSSVYAGGIAGNGGVQTSYNTGNIDVDTSKHFDYLYIGGVLGNGTATDSYNTGNINIKSINDCYLGGVIGSGTANNCYNTGNINQEVNTTYSYLNNYVGGVTGGSSAYNSYNTGDITVVITRPSDSYSYSYVGGITKYGEGENSYNTGKIKTTDVGNNTITEPEVNLEGVPDLTSEEYYNIINQNGVWVHLDGYAPRLLIGEAKKVEATKVEIPNTMKKFIITTEVEKTYQGKGGTITGEDTTPFETVKYGQNNTQAIVAIPYEGYTIESIKVNGKDVAFVSDSEGKVTLPAGYFTDVKEDKNVVVKFAYKEQIVTINKVDSKDNTIGLEGAEFTIEAVSNTNAVFGKLQNIGENGFIYENGSLYSDLRNGIQGEANVSIPIDLSGLEGEFFVGVGVKSNNSMLASISENEPKEIDNNVPSEYVTSNKFMAENGRISEPTFFESEVLSGNKLYYLNIKYKNPDGYNYIEDAINSINIYKIKKEYTDAIGEATSNNASRTFKNIDNDNTKIVLDGAGTQTTNANAYVKIDLSDKTGLYYAVMDITTNTTSPFQVKITNSTDAINAADTNGQQVEYYYKYPEEFNTFNCMSQPLEGGNIYYLQLAYIGGAPWTEINIENLRLVTGGLVETFDNNNGDEIEVLDGNLYFGTLTENKINFWEEKFGFKDGKYTNIVGTPSRSYIELDLRDLEGKYNVIMNAEKGEYSTFTAQITDNKDTELDTNEEGKMIYLHDETPETTYASQVLDGGNIYYLHMHYYGGTAEDVKLSNIRLVKNDTLINVDLNNLDQYEVVETFKNSNNKSYSGKFVTDNNGQIRVKVPRIGNYVITETKAPEGYTLSSTPVYFRVNDISNNVVTIENTAKQKLTVHHYLKEADGTTTTVKVAEDEVSTYDVGTNYETAPKISLQNVELEKDTEDNYIVPANAKGTIGANGEVVTYYYKTTPIELTINHYMEGEETPIAEEEKVEYQGQANIQNNRLVSVNVNQEYNVKNNLKYQDFIENENYENSLITQDTKTVENDKISFTRNSNLTYYYAQRNRTITVKYVNKDTEETVATEETIEKTVGQTYQIDKKEIEGYTFVSSSEALSGIVSENKTIKLYYKQNTTATMNYIERKEVEGQTVETPLDSQTINGYVGEEITGIAKDIDGYMLVERPQQEIITLDEDPSNNVLNYYYEKVLVPSSVLVKHIDKYTNSIIENELKPGYVGNPYQVSAKEYTGYDLVQTVGETQGEMAEEQIEVKFYYSRKITVTVQYIDLLTEEAIVENEVKNGHEGDEYTTTAKQLTGYDLFDTPTNANGEMKATITIGENEEPIVNTNIVVTYGYKEKSEGVREKHIDKITGKVLSQKQHNGYVGDAYQTSAKEFTGYELVETPEKPEGTMKKQLIEVNYYYKAKDFNFKIQKRISKILVDGEAQNIPNGKLAKLEIHRNALDETDLIVEYEIKVSNIGELAGGTTVLETIPSGFTMNESENEGWVVEGENARIVIDNLAAGEEKIFTVKLHWNRGEANLGTKTNNVAIIELKNDANFIDSDTSDNEDSATLLLLISTGTTELGSQDFVFEIILTIITLMVAARMITVTKKFNT